MAPMTLYCHRVGERVRLIDRIDAGVRDDEVDRLLRRLLRSEHRGNGELDDAHE